MKKKYLVLLSFIFNLLLAIPVLAATYYANIQVVESGSNDYTMLPIVFAVDNDYLVTEGYIDSDGLDTRILNGAGTAIPHLVVDDSVLFATAISADSNTNMLYTFGNTSLSSMDIIAGDGGYITITDTAALELGDDFEIEIDGYIDTTGGASRDIVTKTDAFDITNPSSGVIQAQIKAFYNEISQTSGANTITYTGVGQTFQATSSSYITRIHLNVYTAVSNVVIRLYATSGGNPTGCPLATVSSSSPSGTGWKIFEFDTPYKLTNGTTYAFVIWGSGGLYYLDTANPYANGSQFYNITVDGSNCISGYSNNATYDFAFKIDSSPVVQATSITSGEMLLEVYADGSDLYLDIDTSNEDTVSLNSLSVPDNANNWTILESEVIPYADYYKHTVSSTLIVHYQPNDIISGTTLPDREGASQNGTFTWGSNPAGIAVSVGSLVSYSQPAPAGVSGVGQGQDFAGSTGGIDLTADTGTLTTHPFYSFVLAVADNTGFTVQLVWIIGALFTIVAFMLVTFRFAPHQLLTFVVGAGWCGYFVAIGIFPFWTVLIFILAGIGVLIWERSPAV